MRVPQGSSSGSLKGSGRHGSPGDDKPERACIHLSRSDAPQCRQQRRMEGSATRHPPCRWLQALWLTQIAESSVSESTPSLCATQSAHEVRRPYLWANASAMGEGDIESGGVSLATFWVPMTASCKFEAGVNGAFELEGERFMECCWVQSLYRLSIQMLNRQCNEAMPIGSCTRHVCTAALSSVCRSPQWGCSAKGARKYAADVCTRASCYAAATHALLSASLESHTCLTLSC